MKVRICNKLIGSKTQEKYRLDSHDGYMIRMQGHVYEIEDLYAPSNKVKIYCPPAGRSFSFDAADILPVDADEYYGPLPEPVTFDEKDLVF